MTLPVMVHRTITPTSSGNIRALGIAAAASVWVGTITSRHRTLAITATDNPSWAEGRALSALPHGLDGSIGVFSASSHRCLHGARDSSLPIASSADTNFIQGTWEVRYICILIPRATTRRDGRPIGLRPGPYCSARCCWSRVQPPERMRRGLSRDRSSLRYCSRPLRCNRPRFMRFLVRHTGQIPRHASAFLDFLHHCLFGFNHRSGQKLFSFPGSLLRYLIIRPPASLRSLSTRSPLAFGS